MKLHLILFGLGIIILGSCGVRSVQFINDDAYLVKPNINPLGESSADETSYSAFKKRANNGNNSIVYSSTENRQNRRCLNEQMWYEGCGCSYWYWAQYSPFAYRYPFQTYFGWNSFGYSPYYNNYYGYYGGNYWGHNPYYGYSPFYDPFSPVIPYYYGTNPYYGNQTWTYNQSTNNQNIINRPRGSMSGYANPTGRKVGQNVAKSTTNNDGSNGKVLNTQNNSKSSITRKPITNSYQSRTIQADSKNTSSRQRDFISNSSKPSINSATNSSRTNEGSFGTNNGTGRSFEPNNNSSVGRSSTPSNSGNRSGTSGRSGNNNTPSGRRN